jgi:hypothetical protein
MIDPEFDPYQTILELERSHFLMQENQNQVTMAINHHADTIRQITHQNQQLLALYKDVRNRLTLLENAVKTT